IPGMALLITYFREWSLPIIFVLFFLNFLSALNMRDGFPRSVTYGFWSLFVPVGYNRDPSVPLGYQLVSDANKWNFPLKIPVLPRKRHFGT
ncbi:XK-related protein, partial [Caligus rogercresseyi]